MPKYVVISNHPPMSCPSSNKTIRDMWDKGAKDMPAMLQKHSIKPELMVHLDPGHKTLFVLEAPNAETVRDMIYASGLGTWNDFEFYMASSLEDITAWTDKLPKIW